MNTPGALSPPATPPLLFRAQAQTTQYAKDAAMAEALWNLSVNVTGSEDYLKG